MANVFGSLQGPFQIDWFSVHIENNNNFYALSATEFELQLFSKKRKQTKQKKKKDFNS